MFTGKEKEIIEFAWNITKFYESIDPWSVASDEELSAFMEALDILTENPTDLIYQLKNTIADLDDELMIEKAEDIIMGIAELKG